MIKYKYAYATEADWQEKAERKMYAQMLRYVVASRGRTTALKIIDCEMSEIELSMLTDDDLTPENGFYLMGHNQPVMGMLNKTSGYTTKSISFKEDENGQEWAVLKWQWSCKACIRENVLTPEQATALNAELIEIANHSNMYLVPALPIDMTSVIDSYSWDEITETAPTWPTSEDI